MFNSSQKKKKRAEIKRDINSEWLPTLFTDWVLCSTFCFVRSWGLSAMPEESHSALYQGPMGEGKDPCSYIYYAPVIAASQLAGVLIWLFNKWFSAAHLVLQGRTQKCCRAEWKKYLNLDKQRKEGRFERQSGERRERPSYSQNWQRSSLCGCGAEPKPSTQLKPLNARTSTQNVSESQAAKTVCAASGADLVWWKEGPLILHIILVFIIFSCRAKAWTLSLFVSVCLLCPPTPSPPPRLLSLCWAQSALGFHFCWRIPLCL